MHLQGVNIRGYGVFNECRVQNISPGLCVFLGDNEAGKSTFLGFIRDILFGFPDKRSREKTYPPLRGGDGGGTLDVFSWTQGRMLMDRVPGPKGGSLNLYSGEGKPLPPEVLARILGGTNREVFKNVYAFSLSELQTMETLSNDRVKDAIYSAGLGAGISSLPDILGSMAVSREKLFKPRGQNQKINRLVKKLEDTQKEINQSSGEIEAYERIVRELEEILAENETRKERLSSLQARLESLKMLRSLWEEWTERLGLVRKLEELPEVGEFPENGMERYERIKRRLEELADSRRQSVEKMDSLRTRLENLSPDRELLAREQDIRSLDEDKRPFSQAGEEISRLEPEIKSRQENVIATVRRLGGDWNNERIQNFDCSLKVEEELTRFQGSLSEGEKEVEKASSNLKNRREELSRAFEALEEAEKNVAALGSAERDWDRDLAAGLKRDRDRFVQCLEELPRREEECERGRKEVNRFLLEINPGWGREDLYNFDTSLQTREKVEEFRKRFAQIEGEVAHLDQNIESCKERLRDIRDKKEELQGNYSTIPRPRFKSFDEIRQVSRELKELEQKKAEERTAQVREEALQARISELDVKGEQESRLDAHKDWKLPLFSTLFFIAGLALLGLGWGDTFPWQASWIPGGLLGILGLGGWMLLVSRKHTARSLARQADRQSEIHREKASELQSELQRLEENKEDLQKKIRALELKLGLNSESTPESLDADLEQAREDLQRIKRLEDEMEDATREEGKLGQRMEELEKEKKKRLEDMDKRRATWNSQTAARGLCNEPEPDVVARLLDRVDTARAELGRLQETEGRAEHLRGFLRDFAARVRRTSEGREVSAENREDVLSAADNFLQRVEREEERLNERQMAVKERDRLAGEHSRLKAEVEKAEQKLGSIRNELEEEKRTWRNYLQEIGLDTGLSPELAREAVADIEKAQGVIREIAELEDKKKHLQDFRTEYVHRCAQLAEGLGRDAPGEGNILVFVHGLVQELDAARSNAARYQELGKELKDKEKLLEELDSDIASKTGELNSLLETARVNEEEEFLSKGRNREARENVLQRLQTLDQRLMRGTGQSDIDRIKDLFAKWELEDLKEEIPRLNTEIEELENQRQKDMKRSGELEVERDRLASADEVFRLRQEKESLIADLHEQVSQWSRYALTEYLLRSAKEKYEKEQQPQVVKTAGEYLDRITGGEYTGVFAPLGKNTVYAVDSEGRSRAPEELSRGTAEQLYLSLRFGYIDNAGRQEDRLPVVMDDILVNFDSLRAENAAKAIAEMAAYNQVLYFTCHPRTMEIFRSVSSQAAEFSLQSGKIQREN